MALDTLVDVTLGFPSDTGGVVRRADPLAAVDNIFIFEDGNGDKWERVVDGTYRAAWSCKPGVDQTSRLQAIFNAASIVEVIVDSIEITISGTLTIPQGKILRLKNGGALSGSGTVSGGIHAHDTESHVYKGSLSIRPSRILSKEWNVKWFGATGNGVTDDQPAIQRCIDAGIATGIHNWYIPAGNYYVGKGILLRKDNGSGEPMFVFNAKIRGEGKAYATNTIINHTRIIVAGNSFGIGIDRGKGVIIEGIGFDGQNTRPNELTFELIYSDIDQNWVSPGVRDDSWSPHAGVVIDPFTNATQAAANPTKVYPGFEQYYVNTAAGGSTDILIKNCYARTLVVGFCITPHPTPQNGDHIEIKDTWAESNKVGYSLGQSQNRTISIVRAACWGQTETVIDARRYGDGTSGVPEVTNLNVAGGVKYLCRIPGFDQNNGMTIRDCHAELLWAIGGTIGDGASEYAGLCRISNSFINIAGPNSFGNFGAKTIFKGRTFVLENSVITNLQGLANRVHNIDALQTYMSNSALEQFYTFGTVFGQYSGADVVNSSIAGRAFQSNLYRTLTWYTAESSDKIIQILGDISYEEPLVSNNWPNRLCRKLPKTRGTGIKDTSPGYPTIALAPVTVSAVDYNLRTATLQFAANGDDVKRLQPEQPVFMPGTNQFGDAVWVDMGHVDTINTITGAVTIKYINTFAPTSGQMLAGSSYTFYLMRAPRHFAGVVLGDTTSGSNTISNVDTNAAGVFFPQGSYVDMPEFPPFTHIINYNPATKQMVMSHAALQTKNAAIIQDVRVIREVYLNQQPIDAMGGWTEGDVCYNTGANPAFDNVLQWVCTRSGLSGIIQQDGQPSTKASEWKAILRQEPTNKSAHALTMDGSVSVSSGRLVSKVLVKPSSGLTAFRIGLTNGGEEVASLQPVTSGEWTTFLVDRYFETTAPIYFGGITSNTDLIIFYE